MIRRPPAVSRSKAFAFDTGYMPPEDDHRSGSRFRQQFAASHYDFVELMRQIALSDLSYSVPSSAVVASAH